jgi:hypothetical protein
MPFIEKLLNKKIIIYMLLFVLFIVILYYKQKTETMKNTKEYTIAIMGIFKNEQDYMEEWLNHHIAQGVEQIYLYCNDPDLSKYPYLLDKKYDKYVTLIDWVDKENDGPNTIQKQAYFDCVKNYSSYCQFLLMLDLDEFLTPIKNYKTITQYIYSMKKSWDTIKAFKIQRYDFGSNGHIKKPKGGVVQNYKYHEKLCSSFKTMANTDYIDKDYYFFGVHDYNFLDTPGKIYNEYFGYHETGFPNSCKPGNINELPMVINHYYTKSYDEYLARCNMWKDGGVNPVGYRTDCENKFNSRDVNEVEIFD